MRVLVVNGKMKIGDRQVSAFSNSWPEEHYHLDEAAFISLVDGENNTYELQATPSDLEYGTLIVLLVVAGLKGHFHWRYYVLVNGLRDDLEISDYIFEKVTSFFEFATLVFRFYAPVFLEEGFYDDTDSGKRLRRKTRILLGLYWVAAVVCLLVALRE